MFSLKPITNDEVVTFFNNDPKLAYLGCPDDDLVNLYHFNEYTPSYGSEIVGIYEDEELIGLLKYEPWTSIAINIHVFLSSKYHHSGKTTAMWNFAEKWLSENNPKIKKLVVLTPSTCVHIPPVIKRYGFEHEGTVKNAVMWRQETVDILIYGRSLN